MKYVLVTGGVVSGLGKGVTASSIGVLLKGCGLRVTSIKIGQSKLFAILRACVDVLFLDLVPPAGNRSSSLPRSCAKGHDTLLLCPCYCPLPTLGQMPLLEGSEHLVALLQTLISTQMRGRCPLLSTGKCTFWMMAERCKLSACAFVYIIFRGL